MARTATPVTKKDLAELKDNIKMEIYKDLLSIFKKEGTVNVSVVERKLNTIQIKYKK